MPTDELHRALDELRTEIGRLGIGELESKKRLDGLITDIERRLAEPDDADHHRTVVENVRTAVTDFEVSHPRATGILNDIMVTLGNMGI